jgi:hypothetical protein
VEDALGFAIIEKVAALGVLDVGDEGRILNDRLEARLGGAQCRLDADLLADIAGDYEHRRAAGELDRGRADLDIDERARLPAMAPATEIAQAGRALGDHGLQPGHLLFRTDVRDAHSQELGTRIAVVLDRGLVDLEEGESRDIVDPHRRRTLAEEDSEARFFLDAAARQSLFVRIGHNDPFTRGPSTANRAGGHRLAPKHSRVGQKLG